MGDLVDDASIFEQWYEIMTAISDSQLSDLDMVQVLGNHEYYGNPYGEKSDVFFNMPSDSLDYYSVEYQNT